MDQNRAKSSSVRTGSPKWKNQCANSVAIRSLSHRHRVMPKSIFLSRRSINTEQSRGQLQPVHRHRRTLGIAEKQYAAECSADIDASSLDAGDSEIAWSGRYYRGGR